MSKVNRYDLVGDMDGNCNLNEARMELSDDGVYVKHSDYEALQAKCAELAAENAAMKSGAMDEIKVINRGGQAYSVKDGVQVNPMYARGWNDYRAKSMQSETPATDAFLAEVRAQGVDMAACALDNVNQFNYANMLDDLAQKIRKGGEQK